MMSSKCVMESILATEAEAIRDFLKGLRGTLHVTFEEGTQAAWLYEMVKPVVAEVIVCNPRRNKLLAVGNKPDRVDAQKLAALLRCGQLKAVYHGTPAVRLLKELVHSYDSLVGDTTRVMNRVKAIYRGRAIGCAGRDVFLYQQLDTLRGLRREAKKLMLKESRRHPACLILKAVPVLGPIRIAQILAKVASPRRFRTKRQFWAYCGPAVVT